MHLTRTSLQIGPPFHLHTYLDGAFWTKSCGSSASFRPERGSHPVFYSVWVPDRHDSCVGDFFPAMTEPKLRVNVSTGWAIQKLAYAGGYTQFTVFFSTRRKNSSLCAGLLTSTEMDWQTSVLVAWVVTQTANGDGVNHRQGWTRWRAATVDSDLPTHSPSTRQNAAHDEAAVGVSTSRFHVRCDVGIWCSNLRKHCASSR